MAVRACDDLQERGERYRERMADVSEKVAGHLVSLEADEILSRSSQVEKIATVARHTFGFDKPVAGSGSVNLSVLTGGVLWCWSTRRTSSYPLSRQRQVGGD